MKRILRFFCNNKSILYLMIISFVIPVFIMALAYYMRGIYPGGPYTVLTSDMGAQYMPFWASLRYIGKSDNSIFLNMSGALANNFMGFAYYISPLTWMTVLFDIGQLPEAIYFFTLIRIGLCGAGFSLYLYYTYNERRHRLSIILLSCCYALMSYNVGYSINLMWLDAVLMLPWILVGVERILRKNAPTFFIISVFLSLLLNYYITFMSGVFVCFYILIRLAELKKLRLKDTIKFVEYGIVGIGMSAPILLPGVVALTGGKLEEDTRVIAKIFRYRLIDIAGQLFSGRYDTLFDDGLPLIFCGSATIALVLIYFLKSKDEFKIKILWFSLIMFYLFSMVFVPLDRVMHGFKETTCFEVRYSFVLSCLLLILAYRGADAIVNSVSDSNIVGGLKVVCTLFVLAELYINSSIIISGIMTELRYGLSSEYKEELELKREMIESIEDNGFYRISDYNTYTFNDGAWLGYNGIGYFSSCYNLNMMNFLGVLGENQSYHVLTEGQRTPLEESLLGVKYRIAYSYWHEEGELLSSNEEYSIYKNEYPLSIGYMKKNSDYSERLDFSKNAFENQNIVARELSGVEEEVFVELKQKNYIEEKTDSCLKKISFEAEALCDAPIWIYFENTDDRRNNNGNKDTALIVNGDDMGLFVDPHSDSSFLIYLGRYLAGESIHIEAYGNIYFGEAHLAYMDEDIYRKVIDALDDNMLEITEHSSGHFTGTINAGKGGRMLLTFPVMNGWRIKVDGKMIKPDNYRGVLLTIPVDKGEHEIDIRFVSPGLCIGIMIGVISLVGLVSIIKCSRKYEETRS